MSSLDNYYNPNVEKLHSPQSSGVLFTPPEQRAINTVRSFILNSAHSTDKDTSFQGAAQGKSWTVHHTSAMTEEAVWNSLQNKENIQQNRANKDKYACTDCFFFLYLSLKEKKLQLSRLTVSPE